MISNSDIKNILECNLSISEKMDLLINTANQNGGMDNISVILVKQEDTL